MSQKYDKSDLSIKKNILNNFVGGVSWGIGITLGATLLLAIIGYAISQINYIPIVGNFVVQIQEFVEENNQQFNNYNNPQ